MIKKTDGGVTGAKGFFASSCAAGIKYQDRQDMALIYSQVPCKAAGVFTSNVVKAACVLWDQEVVTSSPYAQAVIINSGIANACTGKEGRQLCEKSAQAAATELGIPKDSVLLASTGVIGMQIDPVKITAGIKMLGSSKSSSKEAALQAAKAIMTTDTVSKEACVTFTLEGKTVTVGGMCKGSGMIHPDMCTMLGFITTDIAISKELLSEALKTDVVDTFNMVSVDGDTSTNDTLLLLANGLAGNQEITEKGEAYTQFLNALHAVNEELAQKMAGDGEGATALFEVKVIHAAKKQDARTLAKSVICSSLTKAAIFGHDANWGRILCALGYSGVRFDPELVSLYFIGSKDRLTIYESGKACDYSEEAATAILSEQKVTVLVDMKQGDAEATAWGCDLSYEYVKINADYRS